VNSNKDAIIIMYTSSCKDSKIQQGHPQCQNPTKSNDTGSITLPVLISQIDAKSKGSSQQKLA
jgi:hypothetical protein